MLWTVAKEAAENWSSHKDSRQGAALAYYSVFSLGPLIVIAIAIAGFVFGREAVSGQIASSIKDLLGDTGAKAVQAMLVDASRPREGLLATSLGLGALLFAAIGVVVQLKVALNTVWEVDEAPGSGLWYHIRSYVVSFAGVLALGFLLLVSLLVTTALAAIGKYGSGYIDEWILHLTSLPSGLLCGYHTTFCNDVQMASGHPSRLVRCLAWCNPDDDLLRDRKIGHRLLHRQAGTGIDLWGCRVNHCGINLGLLFIADCSDGCRSHPCVRKASRLDQDARPVLQFF